MLETPVLFLIFNRPGTTAQVFNSIREQKPKYLFLAADGPRANKPEEAEKCMEVKEIVLKNIDWDCEVKTLFRDENLGCGKAVSSAITWFFDIVDEGIILEDDCLPNNSFFNFCSKLLELYRDNEKIMMISGNNFQFGKRSGNASYYFSSYVHIWGWATWKRAWLEYRLSLDWLNDETLKALLTPVFQSKLEIDYWSAIYKRQHKMEIDTWDYQWMFAIWKKRGFTILPQKNLVQNIGFNQDATHTKVPSPTLSKLLCDELDIESHPKALKRNYKADQRTFNKIVNPKSSFIIKLFQNFAKFLKST